jgi:Glycosyl transferases group 1
VSTSFARHGLRQGAPISTVETPGEWLAALDRLWADPAAREEQGRLAREWAVREHSWTRTALDAAESLSPDGESR